MNCEIRGSKAFFLKKRHMIVAIDNGVKIYDGQTFNLLFYSMEIKEPAGVVVDGNENQLFVYTTTNRIYRIELKTFCCQGLEGISLKEKYPEFMIEKMYFSGDEEQFYIYGGFCGGQVILSYRLKNAETEVIFVYRDIIPILCHYENDHLKVFFDDLVLNEKWLIKTERVIRWDVDKNSTFCLEEIKINCIWKEKIYEIYHYSDDGKYIIGEVRRKRAYELAIVDLENEKILQGDKMPEGSWDTHIEYNSAENRWLITSLHGGASIVSIEKDYVVCRKIVAGNFQYGLFLGQNVLLLGDSESLIINI